MKRIRERLEGLEERLGEAGLAGGLRAMAAELAALAAYARVAEGVPAAVREELQWTAGLLRESLALTALDTGSVEATEAAKRSRVWHGIGAVLDRLQDLTSTEPLRPSDLVLDPLSVVLPIIGGGATVEGAVAAHGAAIAGAQSRLHEVLWHHLLDGKKPPAAAWQEVEKNRAVVERCAELVFLRTEDPRARAATLLLLYLGVAVARLEKLRAMCG